jgi:hypothetical protein
MPIYTYPTSEGVCYRNHTFFKIWPKTAPSLPHTQMSYILASHATKKWSRDVLTVGYKRDFIITEILTD